VGKRLILLRSQAYRIVQETMTNVIRHSEVKSAVVGVQGDDKSLRIKISDEGIGFVLQTTPGQKSSLGLSGMCERACQVGGMLTIEVFQGSVLISAFLAALANNWSKVANQMGLPTRSFAIMADAI